MLPVARRRFLAAGLGLGALSIGALLLPQRKPLQTATRRQAALGTTVECTVLHEEAAVAERAIDAALAAIDQVEDVMSLYRPTSQLCQLNRAGHLAAPHPWLVDVLRQAEKVSRVSNGAFDVTVQPLWSLWSQATKAQRLPSEEEVSAVLSRVDWRAVQVDAQRVALLKPGMQLTLNGIAQGFAADRAVAALHEVGIEHALVNAGEVNSLGNDLLDEPWTAGVQHPRLNGAYAAVADLPGRALSTSGDYSTHFTPDFKHHHIVDPRRGYSPEELASVSIVAPTACEADALSTAVMVLGVKLGLELIARFAQVDGLLMFKDGRWAATPGFPYAEGLRAIRC